MQLLTQFGRHDLSTSEYESTNMKRKKETKYVGSKENSQLNDLQGHWKWSVEKEIIKIALKKMMITNH